MSKILIASIGSGNRYSPVTYRSCINPEETLTTQYVFEALMKFHRCDKFILVGTSGSAWCSLYDYITGPDNQLLCPPPVRDEDYRGILEAWQNDPDNSRKNPESAEAMLNALRHAFGGLCLDICILKYGITNDELMTNFTILRKLSRHLKNGDELVFDITHSFRSLPIYELLAVNYFKDVARLDIRISAVTYGMLEIRECAEKPIVNLLPLINLLDCIKAADEYNRFGTTNNLLDILEHSHALMLAEHELNALRLIGGTVEGNKLEDFKELVARAHDIVVNDTDEIESEARILIDSVFKDIDRRFYSADNDEFEMRCKLANWHCEKHRYLAASIIMGESILWYCAKISGISISDQHSNGKFRKAMKNILYMRDADALIKNFAAQYDHLRQIRNAFAHPTVKDEHKRDEDISRLVNIIRFFGGTYSRRFKNQEEKTQLLAQTVASAYDALSYAE